MRTLARPGTGGSIHPGALTSRPSTTRTVLSLRLASSVLAAVTVAAFLPTPATGQGAPLTVESRIGAAVPLSTFANGTDVGEGTTTGAVFGVELALSTHGRRTWYAGFSQARYGCRDAGCPAGDDYVVTGVNAGVRLTLLQGHRALPWVGLGVTTVQVESPGVTGSPAGVSDLGFGGEVAAGLYLRAGRWVAFTPAVRLSQTRTDLPGGHQVRIRSLAADLGVVLVF